MMRLLSTWLAALLLILAAGCSSTRNNAPVADRAVSIRPAGQASAAQAGEATSRAPGPDNANKPGYYTVRPGDTLIRIGLDNGQNWRDIVRWNGIENPNLIEVGQVLRVIPPGQDAAAVAARPTPAARADARPLDKPVPPTAGTAASPPGTVASSPTPGEALPKDGDDAVSWIWPASGPVGAGFEEGRSKGLSILGKAGDAVLAAADGRVVYAGSGLRGYGNLVIVKHNNTYLTAYAHNQTLLVKEDQAVRRGQKIAEMGSSDADRVQLHFEIRRLGKPIDPARLLPAR